MGRERKSKRRRAPEEEGGPSSGSDDEFYDRTKKLPKPAKGNAAVLTVKTLCSKLQAQEKDAAALRAQLQVPPPPTACSCLINEAFCAAYRRTAE